MFAELTGSLNYPVFIVTTTDGARARRLRRRLRHADELHPAPLPRLPVARQPHVSPRARAPRSPCTSSRASARDLAELFGGETGDEIDKLARCEWTAGPHDLPILDGCPSWFAGSILSRHDLGDHEGYLLDPIAARYEPGELLYFQDVKDIEPGHARVTAARNEPLVHAAPAAPRRPAR